MRYNDCLDCDQPIGMYQDRCDDCTKKLIMCLSDGAAMVDMENGKLKDQIKSLEFELKDTLDQKEYALYWMGETIKQRDRIEQKLKQIEDILNAPSKYPNGCDEMDALEELQEAEQKIREVIEKKT